MNKFLVALVLLCGVWDTTRAQDPTCQCVPPESTGEEGCCTFTIGWWKNHNKYKEQPSLNIPWPVGCADPLMLKLGEDSPMYGGATALEIMDRSGEDPCDRLAHQFIAATMNSCNGACEDAQVTAALAAAWTMLMTPGNCPGNLTSPQVSPLNDLLDEYNKGFIGPGHCDSEQPPECPVFDCTGGCTYTQGYWKTHSSKVSGKSHQPWSEIPIDGGFCPHDEDTILYGSVTWYDVLATAPSGGDACNIAGKQYVAARLNIDCNEACIPELFVQDALDCVADKLNTSCPGLTPGDGKLTDEEKAARDTILTCARTLDAYNNGFLLGPGHCEDTADDENGNGNGNGNGKKPDKTEQAGSISLTTGEANAVQISTLVVASIGLLCFGLLIFGAWKAALRSAARREQRRYRRMEEESSE